MTLQTTSRDESDQFCFSARPQGVPGYKLLDRLALGGAEVWRAEGPGVFPAALWFTQPTPDAEPDVMAALVALKRIRHPNLLTAFGSWQVGPKLVLATELPDRTLWDRFLEAVAEGGPGIPRHELIDYLDEAARGIDHLLDEGRARHGGDSPAGPVAPHGEISPHTILLIGGGAKVANVGPTRWAVEQPPFSDDARAGSDAWAWAAPERLVGLNFPQSDQYSLAATYCQMRTGRLPVQPEVADLMTSLLLTPPDLSMLPIEEQPAVARALAKDPAERWPSCRAFVEALRADVQAVAALPASAVPTASAAPAAVIPFPAIGDFEGVDDFTDDADFAAPAWSPEDAAPATTTRGVVVLGRSRARGILPAALTASLILAALWASGAWPPVVAALRTSESPRRPASSGFLMASEHGPPARVLPSVPDRSSGPVKPSTPSTEWAQDDQEELDEPDAARAVPPGRLPVFIGPVAVKAPVPKTSPDSVPPALEGPRTLAATDNLAPDGGPIPPSSPPTIDPAVQKAGAPKAAARSAQGPEAGQTGDSPAPPSQFRQTVTASTPKTRVHEVLADLDPKRAAALPLRPRPGTGDESRPRPPSALRYAGERTVPPPPSPSSVPEASATRPAPVPEPESPPRPPAETEGSAFARAVPGAPAEATSTPEPPTPWTDRLAATSSLSPLPLPTPKTPPPAPAAPPSSQIQAIVPKTRVAASPPDVVALADQLARQVAEFEQVFRRTARTTPGGQAFLADARVLRAAALSLRQASTSGDAYSAALAYRGIDAAWRRMADRVNRLSPRRAGPNVLQIQSIGDTSARIGRSLPSG